MSIGDGDIVRRSMLARPVSTLTTAAMVGIAVALMLTLLTLKDASQRAFERDTGNMHLVVSGDSSALESVLNNVFYFSPPQRALPWQRFEELRTSHPWEFAIPSQQGDSFEGRPVLATVPEFFLQFQPVRGTPWRFAGGRAFTEPFDPSLPAEQRRTSFEVVAGAEAARAARLSIGATINLTHGSPRDPMAHVHEEYDFEVVGILEPTGTLHDRALFVPLSASWVMHAHDIVSTAPGWDGSLTGAGSITTDLMQITGVYLALPSRRGDGAFPAATQQVYDQLRRDTSITVANPRQEIFQLRSIIGNVDWLLLAIAAIVLLSSAVSIGLALANAMGQRRRQIAVLRVLGASRRRIFGLVLTESAAIGLLGALLGVALGLIGMQVASGWLFDRTGMVVDALLSPRWAAIIAAGAVLLSALAGIAPALLAYRTTVFRNLRPMG